MRRVDEPVFPEIAGSVSSVSAHIVLSASGIDGRTAVHLVRAFGSAEAVLAASPEELVIRGELKEAAARRLVSAIDLKRAREEQRFVERYGIRLLAYGTESYPDSLSCCEDAPLLLYVKGDAHFDFSNPKTIAVVGTRRMTAEGKVNCERFIERLAEYHPDTVIVSGLAYGIDGTAHRAALKNGLKTVAVVAHGLDRIYPADHRSLAEEIVRSGGAIVSEYPSGTEPQPYRFLERNRIVAGLTVATVVVESPRKGGSLVTADIADSYGREVFAFPARLSDKNSEGNIELLRRNRAILLTDADDMEYALNWKRKPISEPGLPFPLELTEEERAVYNLFDRYDRITVEHITGLCGFGIVEANVLLTNMELNGIIKAVMGRMYIRLR